MGGGQLETPGAVRVPASVLFPGAPKHLSFCINVDLAQFEWPMSGSNFSSYLDVPRSVPVVVYRQLEGGQDIVVSWEDAQAEGCGSFAVRAVVAPCSTQEAFVQLGAVPFSIEHMLKNFAAVYDEPFMPNTMLRVSRKSTKLLPGSKVAKSQLVKRVKLVVQDVGSCGLGIWPFYSAMRFNPAEDPMFLPEMDVVRRALAEFMGKGKLPVTKSAASLPAALTVASQGDKNSDNVLPPLRTPWTALQAALAGPPPAQAGMSHLLLGANAVSRFDSGRVKDASASGVLTWLCNQHQSLTIIMVSGIKYRLWGEAQAKV